jgi:hypothetical protein
MARELNALQKGALETIRREGKIKKGDGWTLATARALATRALCTLEERKDASGRTYYWCARRTSPAPAPAAEAPAVVASSQVRPAGAHVIRVAVRNPQTEATTFTEVRHLADDEALRAELSALGVPLRDQVVGTGGVYTSERQKLVWRDLRDGALWEFVCGGEVYRVRPSKLGGWEAVSVATEEVVAAGNDPCEVEGRARSDAAAFHRALRS